jgi:hypothetical protein
MFADRVVPEEGLLTVEDVELEPAGLRGLPMHRAAHGLGMAVCAHCDGSGEGFRAEPKGCTCAFGLVLVAPMVQRRRGSVVIADEHWSTYNQRMYSSVEVPAVYEAVSGIERGRVVA